MGCRFSYLAPGCSEPVKLAGIISLDNERAHAPKLFHLFDSLQIRPPGGDQRNLFLCSFDVYVSLFSFPIKRNEASYDSSWKKNRPNCSSCFVSNPILKCEKENSKEEENLSWIPCVRSISSCIFSLRGESMHLSALVKRRFDCAYQRGQAWKTIGLASCRMTCLARAHARSEWATDTGSPPTRYSIEDTDTPWNVCRPERSRSPGRFIHVVCYSFEYGARWKVTPGRERRKMECIRSIILLSWYL